MDIEFCSGEHKNKGICPKRESCKRYLWSLDLDNHNEYRQSWAGACFVEKLSGISCDMYINKDE